MILNTHLKTSAEFQNTWIYAPIAVADRNQLQPYWQSLDMTRHNYCTVTTQNGTATVTITNYRLLRTHLILPAYTRVTIGLLPQKEMESVFVEGYGGITGC